MAHKANKENRPLILTIVCLTSIAVMYLVFNQPATDFVLFNLTSNIEIAFRVDKLSRVFALLVSVLWTLAVVYAFEYMSTEHRQKTFFKFYVGCYFVTLGICFAANLITMYLFYELLTLITIPLITHERDKKGYDAGKKYIVYSIGGATASFIGIMIFTSSGGSFDFVLGGTWVGTNTDPNFCLAFMLMFFGFGVKAAVFPFFDWLPSAGVAPTPVTALLHAVAVVKAGTFAVIRVSYYCFGMAFLHGTWMQTVAMSFAAFTIVFGSAMALREQHWKRRLAYSTVSNLSYILFGAMLFTQAGVTGALMHMLFHGIMKITLFFVAGIVNVKTHRYYVYELEGFGRKMPVTFGIFTVASMALVGIPPLCGFNSKYYIATAAAAEGGLVPCLGIAALLISAVLTALYLLSTVVIAFFPRKDFDMNSIADIKDPNYLMLGPLLVFVVLMIVLGLNAEAVMNFVNLF